MRATSLGACAAAPGTMYAVAAGGDEFIVAVLASPDGGATWNAVPATLTGASGSASPTGPAAGMSLPASAIEPVRTPTFAVSGRLMYALKGVNSDVYGLFASADGSNMTWDHVATLPLAAGDVISAVTSATGAKVVAGTRGTASMFHFDMANPSVVTPATGLPGGRSNDNFILQIVLVSEAPLDAYAIRFVPGTSTLFRASGGTAWSPVNGSGQPPGNIGYFCLAADTSHSPALVILGAEDYVYASSTSGATWENISNGLPRVSHCSDLRVVTQPDGHRYLYLATFGRSVWRAAIT
jgi:hypothetical protein